MPDRILERIEELEKSAPRLAPKGGPSAALNPSAIVESALSASATPMASGRYYVPYGTTGTLALTLDRLTFVPFTVGRACTLNALLLEVTTAGAAGAVLRGGIYADNGGLPGALMVDAGTQSATAAGMKTYGLNLAVPAGRIWIASAAQVAESTVRVTAVNFAEQVGDTAAPVNLTAVVSQVYQEGVAGAFPANATPSATSTAAAPVRFALRAA